jgi:hypothetical protein
MKASLALFLLAAGFAVPVPASAQGGFWSRLFGPVADGAPPWAVEAPGETGARYGLGLDAFFEHQESLRITFNEQRITSGDLSEIVRTDPGLLNRKFDLRWDLAGLGVQPAVTLPLPRTLGIYPTLVFQAAVADVGLDFHDRNVPGDSSSLDGRGPLFGSGLDLTRTLCRSCPWFAGASYFFQKIPSMTIDRSPAFAPAGFEVLEDRVRLGRDVHAVSARAGYGSPGSPAVFYVGALHRWNDVTIDDRLRYRDPFRTETALSSRTRLESEVTLALAGVEARLGPRLFGRLEASVGDGDRGGLLRLVYLAGPSPNPPKPPHSPSKEEYARIAGRLLEIRTELAAFLDNLGDVVALDVLLEQLDHFEREVLDTLADPEYAALRDLVTYEFQKVRDSLMQGGPAAPPPPRAVTAAFDPRRPPDIELAAERNTRTKAEASKAFQPVRDLVDQLWKVADHKDLDIKPCIKTKPIRGAQVWILRLRDKVVIDHIESNQRMPIARGSYGYRVTKGGYATLECPAPGSDSQDCRLNLLSRARPLIRCTLSVSKDDPDASCTVDDEPSNPWDCEAP